jgi:hypothetical protein
MTLGEQFESILTSRLNFEDIEMYMARAIDAKMKQNVDEGKGFSGRVTDEYRSDYEKIDYDKQKNVTNVMGYAKYRQDRGFRIDKTNLQLRRKRIKNTIVEAQDGAVISFVEGGDIFKYHHDGIDYKKARLKVRSIFPKEGSDSLPQDIIDDTTKRLTAKLRGK